ncbi:MAG: MFS transporter [Alphaproteobacteria bacterium]
MHPQDSPSRTAPRRAVFSWCVYDWANSAFSTVIVTFVFAAYFSQSVAESVILGTAQWGWAVSASGLAIAILSPIFGAIADQGGGNKPWLAGFTVLCVIATALLWFTEPDPRFALWALVCFAIANMAQEMGYVFYNAMLPNLAPIGRLGRVSGWGWGLGYLGGMICLILTLVVFVRPDAPLFGLDKEQAEHIRVVGPLAAIWFAVFAVPLFLFTPDRPAIGAPLGQAARDGISNLIRTLRQVRRHANIARFLLARLIYIDGLNTMFAFGGIYAAGTFGMGPAEILEFGIALNITAGLGAASFAWIDDWIGAKRTILIALAGLIGFGTSILLVEDKTLFWILVLFLGIFMGPAQAASRSLMARLAPPQQVTEMFGLFALSGKITAFVGPAIFASVTLAFDSQRAGMATVIVFLLVGGLMMLFVSEQPDSQA